MRKFTKKLFPKSFVRNTFLIAASTSIAQIIGILVAPILTRLYSPTNFGEFSVFISFVSISLIIVSFRYELAIILPKEDQKAYTLLALCIYIIIFFTVFIFFLQLIFHSLVFGFFSSSISVYLYFFFPISVFFGGIYQAFSFWSIRHNQFNAIAKSKFSQSISQTAMQLCIGFSSFTPMGLFVADIVGKFSGTYCLVKNFISFQLLKSVTISQLKQVAASYRNYPLLSGPAALINQIAGQLPALLLAFFYGAQVAGWYALVQRILGIPSDIIGQSISKVYLGEVSKKIQSKHSDLLFFFLKTTACLLLIGLAVALIIISFGPKLFGVIFGTDWIESGHYARIISLSFIFRFGVVPLSQTLNLLEKQNIQLFFDFFRFLLVGGSLFLPWYLGFNARAAILFYVVSVVILQSINFFITWFFISSFLKSSSH